MKTPMMMAGSTVRMEWTKVRLQQMAVVLTKSASRVRQVSMKKKS